MNSLTQKMTIVEQELAPEYGDFTLFALFQREDSSGFWDVMVSAPWIDGNKGVALKKIADKLKANLQKEEMVKLSGIVILQHDHPELHELDRFNFAQSSQFIEVKNENLLGQDIKQAFFIPLKQAA